MCERTLSSLGTGPGKLCTDASVAHVGCQSAVLAAFDHTPSLHERSQVLVFDKSILILHIDGQSLDTLFPFSSGFGWPRKKRNSGQNKDCTTHWTPTQTRPNYLLVPSLQRLPSDQQWSTWYWALPARITHLVFLEGIKRVELLLDGDVAEDVLVVTVGQINVCFFHSSTGYLHFFHSNHMYCLDGLTTSCHQWHRSFQLPHTKIASWNKLEQQSAIAKGCPLQMLGILHNEKLLHVTMFLINYLLGTIISHKLPGPLPLLPFGSEGFQWRWQGSPAWTESWSLFPPSLASELPPSQQKCTLWLKSRRAMSLYFLFIFNPFMSLLHRDAVYHGLPHHFEPAPLAAQWGDAPPPQWPVRCPCSRRWRPEQWQGSGKGTELKSLLKLILEKLLFTMQCTNMSLNH